MTVSRWRVWIGLACAGLMAGCLGGLVLVPALAGGSQWYPNAVRDSGCSKPIVKVEARRGRYLDLYLVYDACLTTDDRPKTVIDWYDQKGWKVIVDGNAATGTTLRTLGPVRYTSVKAVVSIRRREPTTIIVRQGFRLEIKLGK